MILQTFVVNKFSKYITRVVGNFMKFYYAVIAIILEKFEANENRGSM